jgi:8-amino-7-oxononanoate synthase
MSASAECERRLHARIQGLAAADLLRHPPAVDHRLVVMCSNDYLGLSNDARLKLAAIDATRHFGTGAGASRLVSGNRPWHQALEDRIAAWTGFQDVLLFNNGFAANTGLLGALLGPDDVVFSDALNHASIIDGVRGSRARKIIYPHQDLAELARLLESTPTTTGERWLVTESIFSMDGDLTPLRALADLCDRHNVALIVDEAHAIGVVGQGGRGAVVDAGLRDRVFAIVGTCGKALGSYGAFVAGHAPLKQWLWNRARTVVFSTALPPAACAATHAGIDVASSGDAVEVLQGRIQAMASSLHRAGLWVGDAPAGAIFPIMTGSAGRTMAVSAALATEGFFVQGIRPPTVPEGSSRLRVTVTASTPMDDISRFAGALSSAMNGCASETSARS